MAKEYYRFMNFGDLKKRISGFTRMVGERIQHFSQKTLKKATEAAKSSNVNIAQESSFKQPPEHLRQRKRGTVSEQEIKTFLEDYLEKPPPPEKDPHSEKPV